MTITSIGRDWGPNVSIVRLETTDSIETILITGWLALNQPSIDALNNGPFQWSPNDVILVSYGNGVNTLGFQLFQIFPDFRSVNPIDAVYPNRQNISAFAGGGQTNATLLNIGMNNVQVVATAGDSVMLPDDVLGQSCIVYNSGAATLAVFPFLGDTINNGTVNTSINLNANQRALFLGIALTKWISFIN